MGVALAAGLTVCELLLSMEISVMILSAGVGGLYLLDKRVRLGDETEELILGIYWGKI